MQSFMTMNNMLGEALVFLISGLFYNWDIFAKLLTPLATCPSCLSCCFSVGNSSWDLQSRPMVTPTKQLQVASTIILNLTFVKWQSVQRLWQVGVFSWQTIYHELLCQHCCYCRKKKKIIITMTAKRHLLGFTQSVNSYSISNYYYCYCYYYY